MRDQVVDFVRRWSEKAEIGVGRFIPWLGVTASKFYDWRQRYGYVNEHNGWVPRDFWLELWEKEAIAGTGTGATTGTCYRFWLGLVAGRLLEYVDNRREGWFFP